MYLMLLALTAMKTENTEVLNQFVIETILITPISKIIEGLKNRTFRDCDIKWLDVKLEKFISFAAETLGIKNIITPSNINKAPFTILNDHNTNYYLDKFNTLLAYFENINQ